MERAAWQLQLPLFVWRRATGLRRTGAPNGVYGSQDPRTALSHVISSQLPALYVFHGLGPELDKPEVSDLLREAAQQLAGRSGAVVLTGTDVKLTEALRPLVGPVRLPVATREEYEELLRPRRPRPLRPHGDQRRRSPPPTRTACWPTSRASRWPRRRSS